jgi:nucleoid DNA-binding protein
MINYTEFVKYWCDVNQTSKNKAKESIDTFIATFKNATIEEGGVSIKNFLSSEIKNVPSRECLNPFDGSKIKIPEKKQVKIKVSKKFKNLEV